MRKERDLRDALWVIRQRREDKREELVEQFEKQGFSENGIEGKIEEAAEIARLDGMIEFAEFMQGKEDNEVAQALREARKTFRRLSEKFSGIKPEAS